MASRSTGNGLGLAGLGIAAIAGVLACQVGLSWANWAGSIMHKLPHMAIEQVDGDYVELLAQLQAGQQMATSRLTATNQAIP